MALVEIDDKRLETVNKLLNYKIVKNMLETAWNPYPNNATGLLNYLIDKEALCFGGHDSSAEDYYREIDRNIKITISNGKKGYSDTIPYLGDEKKYYDELVSNGANPDIEKIKYEQFVAPLEYQIRSSKDFSKLQDKYPCHFIFGYLECLSQSDECPVWLYLDENCNLDIKVEWVDH